MTPEQYRESLEEMETWANEEVDRLVFTGVKPVSITAKVDDMIREAAIAMGNRIRHTREIIDIESALIYLSNLLDAHFYGVPKESLGRPPNDLARTESEKWEQRWA